MAQQTAMEQFIQWIDADCTPMDCVMKAHELLKVEREQREQLFNNIIEKIGTYLANDTKPTLDEILPK